MSTDHAVFVLERLKHAALRQLDERVEKHLKDKFYQDVLPAIMKDIRARMSIELVNENDFLEIKIKLKEEKLNATK